MPESSYHLKFLPSVELRGGISHLFRQKNSDQNIGNKKRFPCLRCAFYGWKLFTGRNYLFSQDKYLDLIFKIGIWNWIKNKCIALNILLYNYLVGAWIKNPVVFWIGLCSLQTLPHFKILHHHFLIPYQDCKNVLIEHLLSVHLPLCCSVNLTLHLIKSLFHLMDCKFLA